MDFVIVLNFNICDLNCLDNRYQLMLARYFKVVSSALRRTMITFDSANEKIPEKMH